MNNQPEKPAKISRWATKPKRLEDMTYSELRRWMSQFVWCERYDSDAGCWLYYKIGPDYVVVPKGKEHENPSTRPGWATKPKRVEDMTYYELQDWMSQFMWRERYDSDAGCWRKYRLGSDNQDVVVPYGYD